jgi:hypothetical protein
MLGQLVDAWWSFDDGCAPMVSCDNSIGLLVELKQVDQASSTARSWRVDQRTCHSHLTHVADMWLLWEGVKLRARNGGIP